MYSKHMNHVHIKQNIPGVNAACFIISITEGSKTDKTHIFGDRSQSGSLEAVD